ncbi:pentatricopeptide repeat-containing protein At1g08070, chloroplastic-like isoform X1 [Zingiber officinale]|uniref:pentatricopeptide repeat-containing protein At1g08070, chloroplastic-like isoform X1 n=1 Tax=Zingiber officinale TaxID=94328 RepID=UPI001C4CD5EB|nr:pentatricopeptide repeat-containing protein At1g08070, chloroplastic-like isoform X1 [Zingiber officinale]
MLASPSPLRPSFPSFPQQQRHRRPPARSIHGSVTPSLPVPLLAFHRLLSSGDLDPDDLTLSSLLESCRDRHAAEEGRQIHALAVKRGFAASSVLVRRSLLRTYAKLLSVDDALKLFDRCCHPDLVSCNDLILGLCRSGDLEAARVIFDVMEEKNVVSWSLMVDGYARNGLLDLAQDLFDAMPVRNQFSWNSLISGYLRHGRVEAARAIFDRIRDRLGVVTWTAMVSGHVQNSQYKEALEVFHQMQVAGVVPNKVTIVSILPAITELGALSHGRSIHACLYKMDIEIDSVLGSALVDMYSNCGCLEEALVVFKNLNHKELSAWNSVISGLAAHGRGADALRVFYTMQNDFEMLPNEITFTAVLTACRHTGLTEEGRRMFSLFTEHYKLKPNIRHFGCMVDLLARGGYLKEALEFVESMPMKPNSVIWKTLINACRIHKNVGMADHVWSKVIELGGPQDSGFYTMISSIYKDAGRAGDASKVRMQMNDLQVKKIAGCSWIESDGIVHEFLMDGASFHARGSDILEVLHQMRELMKFDDSNSEDACLILHSCMS